MHTKIIATLGPASIDYAKMKQMVKYGVRIFRLNFSHDEASSFAPIVQMVRDLEHELNEPLTIMGDLSGPKTRIGEIKEAPVQITAGDLAYLGLPEEKTSSAYAPFIPLDIPELLSGLELDMPVSLSDGMLRFQVVRVVKKDCLFELKSLNSGILASNKGIAFPGKSHPMPALTFKDIKDLHEGIEIGLDAFALSFVQNQKDILDIKREIAKHDIFIPVVAKMERKNAVDNLDSILAEADALMVARGDLGLECSLSELPVIQKKIIRACRHAQKPSIVATQMLLSMVKNPIPTRAESTDVANAILDGTDCVMLSEETAVGSYPVEAVNFIQQIAIHSEEYYLERIMGPYPPKKEKNPAKYLAYAACLLGENTESAALVCHSTTGSTARLLSSRRPAQPIYALTPHSTVIHSLNFFWGVTPRLAKASIPNHLDRVEHFVQNFPQFQAGETIILTSGQPTPGQKEMQTNQIKVYYK